MRVKIVLEKEPDGQGYHVYCPTLPGCHSCGDTKEEAIQNIKEAMALYLQPDKTSLAQEIRRQSNTSIKRGAKNFC